MHSITASTFVNASPDKVWDMIGDPSAISAWHPAIGSSEVTGSDRLCRLADGALINEKIEQVDTEGRAYTYSITDSPLPLAAYRSTIKVEEEGAGALVVWRADFEPEGAPAGDVAALLMGVYHAGLTALRTSV